MSKTTPEAVPQGSSTALGALLDSPPEVLSSAVLDDARLFADAAMPLPPRLFLAAVEQAPVAVSITDATARILYVNRAFEALTGYTREELLGRNQSLLSNNATPDTVYQGLWRTIRRKQTWSGTLVNRTKRGGDYLAELTVSPVLDHDGKIAYFLGMHRDVTKVHALERALRQQKTLIETVLDAAPVVAALLDQTDGVILDNQEYKKLLGDLRGQEPADLLRRAVAEQAGFDVWQAVLDGSGFKDVEISLEVAGSRGPRWFACSGERVDEIDPSLRSYFRKEPTGRPRLLLLAHEITGRRREYERAQNENLRARLAEQQLVQGLREALAAAIYQIQVPLNVIHAARMMLRTGGCQLETLAGMIEQISITGQRALTTLHAALPDEAREPDVRVNVNRLLRQVIDLETDRLLAAGIVVDWRPAAVLPELSVQKTQLRCLFKHLVDNAIQAVTEISRPHRELRIATRPLGGAVEVEIQDNGPGIAAAARFRVFEPFFVGWRNKRGRAGMGLALAQEIASQHRGGIEIDGEPGHGCRVRVAIASVQAVP